MHSYIYISIYTYMLFNYLKFLNILKYSFNVIKCITLNTFFFDIFFTYSNTFRKYSQLCTRYNTKSAKRQQLHANRIANLYYIYRSCAACVMCTLDALKWKINVKNLVFNVKTTNFLLVIYRKKKKF